MPDAWRAYLEMALGLTEVPRKRAQKVVGDLANRGGATAAQLQGLVDDLMSAGLANREALTNIVRHEVDRALGVVGLATAEEVDELTTRVHDLERRLRQAQAAAAGGGSVETGTVEAGTGGTRLEQPAPTPRKVAKKAVAKKAVKATPNAMPAAGTTPATGRGQAAPAKKAATTARKAASPVEGATARKAAPSAGPAAPPVGGPAARKKAVAPKTEAEHGPAGTAEAPTAPVKAAAAATELPPVSDARPAGEGAATPANPAAKQATAKQATAKQATAQQVAAKQVAAKQTGAKKTAAKRATAKKPTPPTDPGAQP